MGTGGVCSLSPCTLRVTRSDKQDKTVQLDRRASRVHQALAGVTPHLIELVLCIIYAKINYFYKVTWDMEQGSPPGYFCFHLSCIVSLGTRASVRLEILAANDAITLPEVNSHEDISAYLLSTTQINMFCLKWSIHM